ncbi:hypothetical protein LEMLEM_LOCUS7287 [Lemmus lemmus]
MHQQEVAVPRLVPCATLVIAQSQAAVTRTLQSGSNILGFQTRLQKRHASSSSSPISSKEDRSGQKNLYPKLASKTAALATEKTCLLLNCYKGPGGEKRVLED